MPRTILRIKTWSCEACGYKQDMEPTQENMNKHFNNDIQFRVSDLKANECPSCGLKSMRGKAMSLETRLDKKVTITIMGEEEVDELVLHGEEGKQHLIPRIEADRIDTEEFNAIVGTGKKTAAEFVKKPRKDLPLAEKQLMKQKIREDILKFKAME